MTDKRRPALAATSHVPPDPSGKTGGRFGARQPHESFGRNQDRAYLLWNLWFHCMEQH